MVDVLVRLWLKIMSFDRIRPQSYAPIRLEQSQVTPFFQLLRDRKVVRGEHISALKVTDKPFNTKPELQIDVGGGSKKKAVKRASSGANTHSAASSKRKRVKLEGRLSKAVL